MKGEIKMFTQVTKSYKTSMVLKNRIQELTMNLKDAKTPDEEFELLDRIERLKAALDANKTFQVSHTVSMDTLVSSAAGLLGILLILNYEKGDIITSKGFNIASKWLGH